MDHVVATKLARKLLHHWVAYNGRHPTNKSKEMAVARFETACDVAAIVLGLNTGWAIEEAVTSAAVAEPPPEYSPIRNDTLEAWLDEHARMLLEKIT